MADEHLIRLLQEKGRDAKIPQRPNLRDGQLNGVDLEGLSASEAGQDAQHVGEYLLGVDLTGGDLERTNLANARLGGALLAEANLRDAILEGASVVAGDMTRANLTGANLSRADFRRANFYMADLRNADLRNADLRSARLSRANLAGADLRGANLVGATCNCADLSRAKLRGAKMAKAKLSSESPQSLIENRFAANLAHMRLLSVRRTPGSRELSAATIDDMTGANLHLADLTGVDLTGADLRLAYLSGADLLNANLKDAQLEGAVLVGADLSGAVLRDANLRGADLSAAKLCRADLSKADISESKLVDADLADADLFGACLDGANFRSARLRDAKLEGSDIRRCHGLRLDGNMIRGASYGQFAGDPWSVLRRWYTGSRLHFHLLLLVIFLAPYLIRTLGWIALNQAQRALSAGALHAGNRSHEVRTPPVAKPEGPDDGPGQLREVARQEIERRIRDHFAEGLARLSRTTPCLSERCKEVPIWWVLLDIDRSPIYWISSIIILVYNVLRATLTYRVGALRDEEERSHHAPRLNGFYGYGWLYNVHRVAIVLLLISLASLALHGYEWLTRPVSLPILPSG